MNLEVYRQAISKMSDREIALEIIELELINSKCGDGFIDMVNLKKRIVAIELINRWGNK